MLTKHENNQLIWIDLLNPTPEEIKEAMSEADFPLNYAEDLGVMVPNTILLSETGAIKFKLNVPVVKRTDIEHPHEIKLIATKTHLVSVHYEEVDAIHKFKKEFEVLSVLKKAGKKANGGHLLISLIDELYNGLDTKLDYLRSKIDMVEKEIFNEHEREMVFEMSKISRRLISFRQTIAAQQELINDLPTHLETAFNKELAAESIILKNHYDHLNRRLDSMRLTLEDLHNANTALLYTKQNEIMKILTIMAFITFPLSVFTSTFGMNTLHNPIIGHPQDFWIIVGLMMFVSVFFFSFFKYKRWM